MHGQHRLAEQVEAFVELLSTDDAGMQAAQQAARQVLEAARGADVPALDDAVMRLAVPINTTKISRAALLALVSGALVEQGASAQPVAAPVVARFGEAVVQGLHFAEACVAEAGSAPSSSDQEGDDMAPNQVIERFGQQVSERMPDAARAFMSLEWLGSAALAMLSRSKPLRRQVQTDRVLVQAVARFAELGMELPCFHEMFSILDDEQVVVLYPALTRGYVIRIAGIGNNFQLHTLLADALIGDVALGWLPGERPSPEVVALEKDAQITNPRDLPSTVGAFNLWNWTGLQADGTLPEVASGRPDSSAHWIWNEGIPADIVPFERTRVILLGPPPYARSWNSGRFFPAMVGELEVLRQLTMDEVHSWLDRLAAAPKPVPVGRYISATDVERTES